MLYRGLQDKDLACIKQALNAKPDLTITHKGHLFLHLAVVTGVDAIVESFVVSPSYKDCKDLRDAFGSTALVVAVRRDLLSIGKILVGSGADYKVCNKKGRGAFYYAWRSGNLPMVDMLMSGISTLDWNCVRASLFTCRIFSELLGDSVIAVSYLFAKHEKKPLDAVEKSGEGLLRKAIKECYRGIVRALILLGADPNTKLEDGSFLVHWVASDCDQEIMQLLILKGANLRLGAKENGNMPIHIATQCGNEEMVKVLLCDRVDVTNGTGRTALFYAVERADESLVRLLLDNKANVNACDHDGTTPLHIASEKGYYDVALLLIFRGASLNVKTIDETSRHKGGQGPEGGWSPLFFAVKNGYERIVQLLLELGADVKLVDREGSTPLHVAAWNGKLDIAKLLVEKGANVHAINRNGHTPYDVVTASEHYPVVKFYQMLACFLSSETKKKIAL